MYYIKNHKTQTNNGIYYYLCKLIQAIFWGVGWGGAGVFPSSACAFPGFYVLGARSLWKVSGYTLSTCVSFHVLSLSQVSSLFISV